ncbi:hypothetical protein EV656_101148 [Rhodovulum adriaticum]|uniref:Sulfotransferase family protein n=2 Tax=Rhodovulum adriaticum TaxID=35804 RepID=A0A4R2P0T6_RHOAD|nr:hypothetical protein EV656_101148 [Rhodovulum adriaticum]
MELFSLDRFRKRIRRARRNGAGRVLITGTGRSGTTFIMRVFTQLGLDTGFTTADLENVEKNVGKAGLEKSLNKDTIRFRPEIIKTPHAVDIVDDALAEGWLKLDLCIVPIRELSAAASSRVAVTERARQSGLDLTKTPGGLWKTDHEEGQLAALAESFYTLAYALVKHEIPVIFAEFPRIAQDEAYFIKVFGPVLHQRYGVSTARIRDAWRSEVRPEFITCK